MSSSILWFHAVFRFQSLNPLKRSFAQVDGFPEEATSEKAAHAVESEGRVGCWGVADGDGKYPLVNIQKTIEHGHGLFVDLPMSYMVIFHSFL